MLRQRFRAKKRRAIAAVELAVCLPLLSLLVFGSIQACDFIYLKHSLTSAAYEASLELARPDATNASVSARINQVLNAREVVSATHSIDAGGVSLADAVPGSTVVVTVGAPISGNLMLTGFFAMPGSVTVDFTCTR